MDQIFLKSVVNKYKYWNTPVSFTYNIVQNSSLFHGHQLNPFILLNKYLLIISYFHIFYLI